MPTSPVAADPPPHLLPLPGTDWWLWRECALRSAGFPASRMDGLADRSLLTAAEGSIRDHRDPPGYEAEYRSAVDRSVRALRSFVDDPRFREALAWQNPAVLSSWLERLAGTADNRKLYKSHYHRAIASYAQRYVTKNDSIGFFGPVGWASWDPDTPWIEVTPGPGLLRDRRIYFEDWAIDTLAHAMSSDPRLRPWLVPRMVAGCWRDGPMVHRPYAEPVRLDPAQQALLDLCDGHRQVLQIAGLLGARAGLGGDPTAAVLDRLDQWREQGIVQLDLTDHVTARPETLLRAKLARVADAAARGRALAQLASLERARDRLAAARGRPRAVAAGMLDLGQTFAQLTGTAPQRRPGEMYAARTLVYEDTRRDVGVRLGHSLLAALAAPLRIVLDAASWLVAQAGMVLREQLREIVERYQARTGRSAMPLPELLARATRLLHPSARPPAPLVAVVQDFQDRWAQVLGIPAMAWRHAVGSREIAERAAELLPRSAPPWPGAAHICPDLMIAASDVQEIAQGSYQFVLGELHLATNTLQARAFVEQHDDPSRLQAALAADHGPDRVYSVATRRSPQVNTRTYPSALLPASYTYWCLHDDTGGAAGPVLPAAAMTVHLEGSRPVVRDRLGGRRFDLLQVLDEQLSWVMVNAFRPLPARARQPRVTIDRLVLHRESWYPDPADLEWVRHPKAAERYRLAQRFRLHHGMPVRVFYRLPTEVKPCFLDFSSVALVECFVQRTRAATRPVRGGAGAPAGRVEITELLPELTDAWLPGPDGRKYTSELRMVCVNRLEGGHAGTGPVDGTGGGA